MMLVLYPSEHADRGLITVVRNGQRVGTTDVKGLSAFGVRNGDWWSINSEDQLAIENYLKSKNIEVRKQ